MTTSDSEEMERSETERDMNDPEQSDDRPVVLAVDDRERVAKSFEIWLGEQYQVETALDGETALSLIDDSVDVVLLDRHMPGMSGDEVLTEIRAAGYDCRVAMVTGVNPDFDIVEMAFDEYVQKPLDEAALREAVERLLELQEYDAEFERLYTMSQKRATLEAEKTPTELKSNAEYQALVERQSSLRSKLDERIAAADEETLQALLRDGTLDSSAIEGGPTRD